MELSNEQLTELTNIVEYRIDYWVNNEPEEPEEEAEEATLRELLPILKSELATRQATNTLRTYYILTGEKYFVEATSEEEALNKFYEYLENGETEFLGSVVKYLEADTKVIHID
jgi:hypothetical protein